MSPCLQIADNIETTKHHESVVFISNLTNYKQIRPTFVFMKILLLKLSQIINTEHNEFPSSSPMIMIIALHGYL